MYDGDRPHFLHHAESSRILFLLQGISGQGSTQRAAAGELHLLEDEALVAEAGDGSREAFAELYQRHFGELYDYAARIVRDRDTAADIVQTAFTRAWERAQVDAQIGNARAWLYRVTHNVAIDELRRRSKLESGGGDAESGGFDFAALEDRT